MREAYQGKCAVTGCNVPEVLEAAHIQVKKNVDLNHLSNGLLLRADIHALFDGGLIAISKDGSRLEISTTIANSPYASLNGTAIFRPKSGVPSKENILHHRRRSGFSV
ncbi:MAG: HNH endonuclease [Xanthobacteraceae bacterium]|nr:HNH endonuclease [Xanthobacteraceae bacterium]